MNAGSRASMDAEILARLDAASLARLDELRCDDAFLSEKEHTDGTAPALPQSKH